MSRWRRRVKPGERADRCKYVLPEPEYFPLTFTIDLRVELRDVDVDPEQVIVGLGPLMEYGRIFKYPAGVWAFDERIRKTRRDAVADLLEAIVECTRTEAERWAKRNAIPTERPHWILIPYCWTAVIRSGYNRCDACEHLDRVRRRPKKWRRCFRAETPDNLVALVF